MRISDWISDVCSSDLPVSVALDRYAAIGKSARNAWALRVSGGADTVAVSPGLAASFYGQAGIIGARAHDGYADGWIKMETPIGAGSGLRIHAGAGLWAGAQPDRKSTRLNSSH